MPFNTAVLREFIHLRGNVSAVSCIGNFDYYLLTLDGQLLTLDMAVLVSGPSFAVAASGATDIDESGCTTAGGLKWTWSPSLRCFFPALRCRASLGPIVWT